MKIRPIVKAAFRVDELVYQFEDIDGTTKQEINDKYSDSELVGEAEHRLDIAMDPWNQEEECWRKDADQLRRFIKKWSKK